MIKITLQKSPWLLFRGAVFRVGIFKLKPVGESSMCALEGQVGRPNSYFCSLLHKLKLQKNFFSISSK